MRPITRRNAGPAASAGRALTGDERTLLDVIEALRGADNLKDRLLAALQSGTPAVADLAYAVKARVKEDYKCVDKIKDRRRGGPDREPQPGYGVPDLMDLVGVRIVTLYRLDALEVIEALLTAMNGDTSSSAPFVANSIGQVTIYTANLAGDVQKLPELLRKLFERHGLGAVTRMAVKASNYSSIHILARGRGRYRDGYREVPIEIQVRTALEDVWGQIEHTLKYKREMLAGRTEPSAADLRLQTTLSHLGALKTMIDGIAQYGDQIKLQIDELEPELRYSASKSAEDPSGRLSSLTDLPAALRDEVVAALAEARPGLVDESIDAGLRIRKLRSVLPRLEAIADQAAGLRELRSKTRKELDYIVTMQRALLHFQIGNLLEAGEAQLRRALALYEEMEDRFPARIVVAYRLARTLDALGMREEAIAKLRLMVQRLEQPGEPTPSDHWLRSAAPRGLGVLLWEAALASGGDHVGQDGFAMLREAFEVTLRASRAEVTEDPVLGGGSERGKALNNLLYFLLEYLEAGGPPRPGMDESELRTLLKRLEVGEPAALASLSLADTARRAYGHLQEPAKERQAASRVLDLAAQQKGPRDAVIRDAVRAAEGVLGRPQTPAEPRDGRAPSDEGATAKPARRRTRRPKRGGGGENA